MPVVWANVTATIDVTERASVLAESNISCNILNLLDLIFERLSINEKRNGTIMILINVRIMFNLLEI